MDIEDLKKAAAVVRDATEEHENTAWRVGQLLINVIDTFSNLTDKAIKGYVMIDDVNDLPDSPSSSQQMIGYILGTTLYVWVGEGGDAKGGKYKSVELQGKDGKPGKDGVSLGDVAIADDLDTDDPQQVLSARQGKVLAAMTSAYTYPTIDVSVGANTGAIVPAASGHIWSTGTAYKGRCFDVSDKRGWVLRIHHGDSFATCNFAFLNATPANNQPISYCDGETYHSGVSEEVVTVPSDATLLYVQRLSSGGYDMTPVVEILTKDKDTMYGLSKDVETLKEHDFDPTTVIDAPIDVLDTKSGYYLVKSASSGLQRGDMTAGGAWKIALFQVTPGDSITITTSGNSTSGAPMYAAWYSEPEVAEGSDVVSSLSHDSYINYAVLNCADSNKSNTVTVPSSAVYLALSLSTTAINKVTRKQTVNRIDLLEERMDAVEDGGETVTVNGRLKAVEGHSSVLDTAAKKILVFGNSYSYDAFGFLPHVIKVSNPSVALTLGICMDGSQTLQGQLNHANNPASHYTRYSKHAGSAWENDYATSFDGAVQDEDWDLIVFHQSSNLSCSLSSITPYLPQLISHLRDNGYTGKIGWLVTPAYAEGTTAGGVNKLGVVANTLGLDYTLKTDEMQHRIYDVADYLMSHYAIDVLFPCGMAIGYARHSMLDYIGEWSPADALGGNLVYKDGHHLQYGVGNLIGSWVAAMVITRGRCAMADIKTWGWMNGDIMSSNNKAVGMDTESQRFARECAYRAYHQFLHFAVHELTDQEINTICV